MNEPIQIDDEFKSLIPPLTPDEYRQLEENCKRDGILDSLKVWHGVLVDGHNRLRISEEWDLNYQIEEMDFPDRQAVVRWIILNQFGRRNLSAYDRSVLALKLKTMIAEQKEKNLHLSKGRGVKGGQKSDNLNDTKKELAKVAGVSHDTIHKVEVIEQKAPEATKQQVKSGEKSINQAYLEVKEKERKKLDLSAKTSLEKAEQRHDDFQNSKTVSIQDAEQDKKDSVEIAAGRKNELWNALKKILFWNASKTDFSIISKKTIGTNGIADLVNDLDVAISTLAKIREEIRR